MPTILPISALRNYTEVLKHVDINKPVYLTRNGRGTYVITRIDDYDKEATIESLLTEIKQGEASVKYGAGVPLSEVAKKLNVKL